MKATVFFRMIVLAAMAVIGITNAELKAQEENFVTNEIKDGDLVTSKVIYRMDGSLYRHMKYDFSYDNQKRMTAKEAFKITYLYGGNEITMEYARWNERHKAYIDSVEKSVYELNADNMPVAYVNYKWNEAGKDWSLNTLNKCDNDFELIAIAY